MKEDKGGTMILPDYLSQKNQKIINRYGLPEQLLQLQEECAEVIKAASKYRRSTNTGDKADIAQAEHDLRYEIVDVIVLLDQIMDRIDMKAEELQMMASFKIDRTIGRMSRCTR